MSNQIVLPNGPTGRTAGAAGGFYAVVYNMAGDVCNQTTPTIFTPINTIVWTNADLPMTEQGSTGQYRVAMPGTIPDNMYVIEIREQLGSTPNVLNDKAVGSFKTFWDGSSLLDPTVGPLGDETYAADGQIGTLKDFIYMVYAMRQAVVTGTSFKAKKLDGTTDAMTFTLDDAINPTSMIRTS